MKSCDYNGVAGIYETLGYLYSGRQIYDSKASQIAEMQPLERVLYVGVGPGEDALLAARHGACVTCVDLSAGMLQCIRTRLERESLWAELLCRDILQHDRTDYYDVVVVNFFLNVFSENDMQRMLCHAASLVKPGGKLLISDFMFPTGNFLARTAQAVYWGVTNLFYYLLGLSAWHAIYDYPAYFAVADLELSSIRRFRLWSVTPVGFWSITATRTVYPMHKQALEKVSELSELVEMRGM